MILLWRTTCTEDRKSEKAVACVNVDYETILIVNMIYHDENLHKQNDVEILFDGYVVRVYRSKTTRSSRSGVLFESRLYRKHHNYNTYHIVVLG